MILKWKNELSVGNRGFDRQHKKILESINRARPKTPTLRVPDKSRACGETVGRLRQELGVSLPRRGPDE